MYDKKLIDLDSLPSRTVAVLGAGISNVALISFLYEYGARFVIRDRKPENELPEALRKLRGNRLEFRCGDGYLDSLDEDIIFRSPGIRPDVPSLNEAAQRGATVTSEMELFFSLCPCRIFGITGSDGKTTTTTLISKLLAAQYGEEKVFLGGNIGEPLLPRLPKMDKDCFAVAELSSFQLMDMRYSPDVSVITNVSPNHLDYHRSMDEYTDAKRNIYRHQKPGGRVVLNLSNPVTSSMISDIPVGSTAVTFGNGGDIEVTDEAVRRGDRVLVERADIRLPGRHNAENYAAAFCAVGGYVDEAHFRPLAVGFNGVEHRCEFVRELDGVKYYNSSIDSSPTRTAAALSSFAPGATVVICGGYDKHIPFDTLADALISRAKAVVLTGATAPKIMEAIEACTTGGDRPLIITVDDFATAVTYASSLADPGDSVILSPACASFDRFKNFGERGKYFKSLVNSL